MTEQQTTNGRATLYGKIAAVAAAVSRIPKNGENTFFHYRYATESDITDGLRELLNANGLAFLPPSVIAWERDTEVENPRLGPRTRVQVQFALGCADTGETFTTILWGEANDTADKGFYKAYTGAVKYYLMKTFLIATGDDPEQDTQPPAQPRQPAQNGHGAPVCDVCGTPGRLGKDGKNYFCPKKENHGGKWYTIPARVALTEDDYPPEDAR